MTAVISFFSLSVLLWLGQELRNRWTLFQTLFIPTPVIAGLLGLALAHLLPASWTEILFAGWAQIPSLLINLVFATLFLGAPLPGIRTIWPQAGPPFFYGQIFDWGQYMVGLGAVLFLLKPLFHLPDIFGVLVEVGFEGGHGTAAGLRPTFESLGWSEGTDYALASATVGILSALFIGILLINWAARRGYLASAPATAGSRVGVPREPAVYPLRERPVGCSLTLPPSALDSLTLHLALSGLAIGIGWLMQQGFVRLAMLDPSSPTLQKLATSFPLFPLCMLGGLLLQGLLQKTGRDAWVDRDSFHRLGGMALDILVVTAITTTRLDLISRHLLPFLLICLAGILWNVFAVMVLARRLLPTHWFERSIAEMGQSMGVTATGLLLLRAVDPESRTDAPAAFAYKQLLHEPFMGGGLWTSMAVPLVALHGGWTVFLIASGAVAFWYILARRGARA